ncbi:MAG: hypothetical protein F6K10_43675, partial [Moorea sp. SIO2B7]|nr:hypothetical protein [Moorena sp. SIO2B7]
IMLKPNGQLVLIDFGTAGEMTCTYLAKIKKGGSGDVTMIKSAGYTPPEQQKGKAVSQSDFYALGSIFVYLLTGKHLSDVYDAHNDQFNWRSHTSGISPLLMDFIDQLIARQPSQRPLDTQVILERLKTIERHEL